MMKKQQKTKRGNVEKRKRNKKLREKRSSFVYSEDTGHFMYTLRSFCAWTSFIFPSGGAHTRGNLSEVLCLKQCALATLLLLLLHRWVEDGADSLIKDLLETLLCKGRAFEVLVGVDLLSLGHTILV